MSVDTKKILVTGAAGFIGFHLVRRLLADGFRVVGLDNINNYYDVRLKRDRLRETGIEEPKDGELVTSRTDDNYRFIKLDLNDREGVPALFDNEKFDLVIHLAAQAGVRYSLDNPHAYIDSNLSGFLNILEGCRHHPVEHLIYASSSSVYGANTEMPFKTSDRIDHPVSLYAATKKSNELMAHTYSHLFGIPSTGLRFFTVYGPWGRPDMALFLFTEAISNGKPIDVFNYGEMERDFTYIDDIVEGVVRLIPKAPSGARQQESRGPSGAGSDQSDSSQSDSSQSDSSQPDSSQVDTPQESTTPEEVPHQLFNIGRGGPVALMDFIREIEKNLGREAEKRMMPIQPGDVPKTWADVDDLYEMIEFRPEVSVEEGVRKFIEWYRSYYELKADS